MPTSAADRPGRLCRSADFSRVQSTGRRQRGQHLLVVIAGTAPLAGMEHPSGGAGAARDTRVGLAVSRKVGNAVVRNRVKRWLREAVRALGSSFPPAADLVLIAHASAASAGFWALRADLHSVLTRLSRR